MHFKLIYQSVLDFFQHSLQLVTWLYLAAFMLCDSSFLISNPFGKDADLVVKQINFDQPLKAKGIGVKISQILIGFHHNVITEIDGPRSHYRPSSSQFSLDAIE